MDPYKPPASSLTHEEAIARHPSAYVLLALAFAHFIWLATRAGSYFSLMSTGSAPVLVVLASLLGSVLLYAGASRFALDSTRGTYWFFAAAAWSGASLFGWGAQVWLSAPFVASLLLSLLGWWLVRRCAPA